MQDFITTAFNLSFFDTQEDATESFVGTAGEADLPTPIANVQNTPVMTGPGGSVSSTTTSVSTAGGTSGGGGMSGGSGGGGY